MSWADQFPELNRPTTSPNPSGAPTSVQSLRDIPPEATPRSVFRLPVEVLKVDERETSTGKPCYFLNVRDADGLHFSVVCWDWQWERLRGRAYPGVKAALDVRVPADGYNSFTLVVSGWRPG
jgi:hypothetical protein